MLGSSYLLSAYLWICTGVSEIKSSVGPYVCLDWIALYLVVLTVVIMLCVVVLSSWLSFEVLFFVLLSQVCSLLCYVCYHVVFFWLFYEVSIVSLLYLLLKSSPYSERYISFWYFLGYIVFCGLPMLMALVYYSLCYGSFSVASWGAGLEKDWWVIMLMCVLFITKIPLFPFQIWLPIVHAEASGVVSMCLSGYIMKLGVLGVLRFGSWIVPDRLFCEFYTGFGLLISCLVLVIASFELDSKRWLALMSLCHISLIPVNLCVADKLGYTVSLGYCLGHGVTSCLVFVILWFMSGLSGSRNWFMLKPLLAGSWVWEIFFAVCFCLCGSFPTCVQFYCELMLTKDLGEYGGILYACMGVYLLLSILVSLDCFGCYSVRCRSVHPVAFNYGGLFSVSCNLVLLCVLIFLIF